MGGEGPCACSMQDSLSPPVQTIFEINATARTMASAVMRSKRRRDHALIQKYQRGQQEKRAAALQGQGLRQAPPEPEEREGEEENLQVEAQGQGWAMVLGPAQCPAGTWAPGLGWQGDTAPPAPSIPFPGRVLRRGGTQTETGPGWRRRCQEEAAAAGTAGGGVLRPLPPQGLREREGVSRGAIPLPSHNILQLGGCSQHSFCPPHRLSVGGEGSAFEQQAAGAVLDLMGDENHNLNRSKQLLKW